MSFYYKIMKEYEYFAVCCGTQNTSAPHKVLVDLFFMRIPKTWKV